MALNIPEQLSLLCELLETTPQEVLQAFINDLSLEVNSSGSDERSMAVAYFMRVGYGMHRYPWEAVEQMFDELNTLRWQWPGNDTAKEKQYAVNRKKLLREWYQAWKAKKA